VLGGQPVAPKEGIAIKNDGRFGEPGTTWNATPRNATHCHETGSTDSVGLDAKKTVRRNQEKRGQEEAEGVHEGQSNPTKRKNRWRKGIKAS